ncbi:MAG: hypothetical protein JXA72_00135 [Bacteroidales bacterium]|nr:hypothetical protein [Bacteroidales bacterium]
MKKIALFMSAALFSFAAIASSPSTWVASDDGRIQAEKVKVGFNKATIVLANGEKTILPIDDLDAYSINGKVFEKKTHYSDGEATGKEVFMELISYSNGLKLLKHVEYDYDAIIPGSPVDKFYVYRDNELHLALDQKSMPTVMQFFGVRWSYK